MLDSDSIAPFSIQTIDFKGEIKEFSSQNLNGQYLVLYFYPRDLTSGCTQQAKDFSSLFQNFQQFNAQILGISRDSLKKHQKFIEKENLPFALGADENEKVCTLFDVIKNKKMYGKDVRGIERSTFLYAPNGALIQQWRKVKVPHHVQEVLQTLANFCQK